MKFYRILSDLGDDGMFGNIEVVSLKKAKEIALDYGEGCIGVFNEKDEPEKLLYLYKGRWITVRDEKMWYNLIKEKQEWELKERQLKMQL